MTPQDFSSLTDNQYLLTTQKSECRLFFVYISLVGLPPSRLLSPISRFSQNLKEVPSYWRASFPFFPLSVYFPPSCIPYSLTLYLYSIFLFNLFFTYFQFLLLLNVTKGPFALRVSPPLFLLIFSLSYLIVSFCISSLPCFLFLLSVLFPTISLPQPPFSLPYVHFSFFPPPSLDLHVSIMLARGISFLLCFHSF